MAPPTSSPPGTAGSTDAPGVSNSHGAGEPGATPGRLPYEPPQVVSEEVFETLAVACGKQGTFKCQVSGGNNS